MSEPCSDGYGVLLRAISEVDVSQLGIEYNMCNDNPTIFPAAYLYFSHQVI